MRHTGAAGPLRHARRHVRHLTSVVNAGTLATNGSQWWGMPPERRQAVVALLEQALARAEGEKCE